MKYSLPTLYQNVVETMELSKKSTKEILMVYLD